MKCTHHAEWESAKRLRNKYFFDLLSISDPYTWTFNNSEHVHLVLYQGVEIIGYAHIQFWSEQRAVLRTIVINENYRQHGMGSRFLQMCEQWLKSQGIKSLHDEARENIVNFYRNGFCHHLTDNQWIALGNILRQVHEFDAPSSIKKLIRKEAYSDKWRKSVRSLYAHVESNLKEDEAALQLQAFMRERRDIIHHLVNRAEALSQKIQEQLAEFVLCHSNIHGGNVLIDESGSVFIVDWDDPIMVPKERDFMFIGGGIANVWNNPREEEFFYKGYGKTAIDRFILAYYRHERIVEDIAEYGQALLLTTAGEDRLEMYNQFIGMFEPNGVIDIAFKTDSGNRAMGTYL